MRSVRPLRIAVLLLALGSCLKAQEALETPEAATPPAAPAPGALHNGDVLTLARAGFNEDFLVATIESSRTEFDTTAKGLATLAKAGLTERLIQAMVKAGAPAPAAGSQAVQAKQISLPMRPSPAAMAIVTRLPYYERTSYGWGFMRKEVRVAPPAEPTSNTPRSVAAWYAGQ